MSVEDWTTRVYQPGEIIGVTEALAGCGACRRTIVVKLNPGLMQEFYYCSDREDCGRARDAEYKARTIGEFPPPERR